MSVLFLQSKEPQVVSSLGARGITAARTIARMAGLSDGIARGELGNWAIGEEVAMAM